MFFPEVNTGSKDKKISDSIKERKRKYRAPNRDNAIIWVGNTKKRNRASIYLSTKEGSDISDDTGREKWSYDYIDIEFYVLSGFISRFYKKYYTKSYNSSHKWEVIILHNKYITKKHKNIRFPIHKTRKRKLKISPFCENVEYPSKYDNSKGEGNQSIEDWLYYPDFCWESVEKPEK